MSEIAGDHEYSGYDEIAELGRASCAMKWSSESTSELTFSGSPSEPAARVENALERFFRNAAPINPFAKIAAAQIATNHQSLRTIAATATATTIALKT